MLVVNLFAGPGAGKSTMAAGLFYELKMRSHNVELVLEYAKDLTWEGRTATLNNQAYVFGKQLQRLERLRGKVDVIVTDSPILLSCIYAPESYPPSWFDFVNRVDRSFETFNVYLIRTKLYKTEGRTQTHEEAQAIDKKVRSFLELCRKDFFEAYGDRTGLNMILAEILHRAGEFE
jgi:hypothetical protein